MNAFRSWTRAGRLIAVAGTVGCILLAAQVQDAGFKNTLPFRGARGLDCPNAVAVEPVLIYNRSGGTIMGATHLSLTVYSNGLATLSQWDFSTPESGTAEFTQVPTKSAWSLSDALIAQGAAQSCDETIVVSDMPLTTVTIFEHAGTDAMAHTYSYWSTENGVESIIRQFIETEFPVF